MKSPYDRLILRKLRRSWRDRSAFDFSAYILTKILTPFHYNKIPHDWKYGDFIGLKMKMMFFRKTIKSLWLYQ